MQAVMRSDQSATADSEHAWVQQPVHAPQLFADGLPVDSPVPPVTALMSEGGAGDAADVLPLFWDELPEDAEDNAQYAALQAIRAESTPLEQAEAHKVCAPCTWSVLPFAPCVCLMISLALLSLLSVSHKPKRKHEAHTH